MTWDKPLRRKRELKRDAPVNDIGSNSSLLLFVLICSGTLDRFSCRPEQKGASHE
jgi:hypothetical protein